MDRGKEGGALGEGGKEGHWRIALSGPRRQAVRGEVHCPEWFPQAACQGGRIALSGPRRQAVRGEVHRPEWSPQAGCQGGGASP